MDKKHMDDMELWEMQSEDEQKELVDSHRKMERILKDCQERLNEEKLQVK